MSRWIKVTESLIDSTKEKSFAKGFEDLLRDEDTIKGVLETCINMKTITPEMKQQLLEIQNLNNFFDGRKHASHIFRQAMFRFGPEIHNYLINRSEEYRAAY